MHILGREIIVILITSYFNRVIRRDFVKTDSNMAAKLAGLVISDRTVAGITRKKVLVPPKEEGEKETMYWNYFLPSGEKLEDDERINFFNSLVVPPAWTDVWFDPNEIGHIQATGKDAKGRLQYRYHPEWNAVKADIKFSGIDEFAAVGLVEIRSRVKDDLAVEGMPKYKSAALVIRLMDLFHIRVGSDQYAKENDSYGLTTLKEAHLDLLIENPIEGEKDAIFDFPGKSGKRWRLLIIDDELVSMIQESQEVGDIDDEQDLFMYLDENEKPRDLKAEHINEYLDGCTDDETKYTAKDFRTWAASWKTAHRLALISEATEEEISKIPDLLEKAKLKKEVVEFEMDPIIRWKGVDFRRAEGLSKLVKNNKIPGSNEKERLASMLAVIDTVAGDLGNTRAVCRSSYIRPMIMTDWENKVFMERWNSIKKMKRFPGLSKDESHVFNYMHKYE